MKLETQQKYIFAISSEIADASGVKNVVEPGRAHYSYRAVRDKFCSMFDSQGQPWVDLKHPEIYRDFNLKETAFNSFSSKKVHIAFKPTQYLRTAGGFLNIAHIAWEFDQIRSKYASDPVLPCSDDLRMLKAFDQVWVGCSFTRNVLQQHNIKNIHVIPAPCEVPARYLLSRGVEEYSSRLDKIKKTQIKCWPVSIRNHGFMYSQHSLDNRSTDLTHVIQRVKGNGGLAFLQILNPHDNRKNLKKLIKAFHAFHHDNPNTILILKFTSPEKNERVYEILRWFLGDSHALDAHGVYFTTDYIPEPLKFEFFSLFDFYMSPSRAEGQNLPLQEAMAAGIVPITTDNTAMSDYISEENSVIIPSIPTEITHLTSSDASTWGFQWHDCSELDILKALVRARQLASETRANMAEQCRSAIINNYSFEAVSKLVHTAVGSK